jgi:hypothetical protein
LPGYPSPAQIAALFIIIVDIASVVNAIISPF